MGALPKKKVSKSRRGQRRNHIAAQVPAVELCPQCHNPKLPHHVCPTCGSYAGREIVEVESPRKKTGR